MRLSDYISAINNLIWSMKTKTNREEEAQKEDYPSINMYKPISIVPTAWCPLNNENFYTVNIYWEKKCMKHSLDKHWYLQIITLLRVEEDKVSAQQTCPIPMLVTAVKLGVEITRPIVARTAKRGKKRLFNKCRRKKRATNQGQSGAKLNAHMSSLAEMRICHMPF